MPDPTAPPPTLSLDDLKLLVLGTDEERRELATIVESDLARIRARREAVRAAEDLAARVEARAAELVTEVPPEWRSVVLGTARKRAAAEIAAEASVASAT